MKMFEMSVYSFVYSFRIADFYSLMKRNGACSIAVYILCIHFAESAQLFHHQVNSQRCVSMQERANALPQNLTVSLFLFEATKKPQTFFSIPLTSEDNESMFIVFVFRCATASVVRYSCRFAIDCTGFCVFIHDIAICRWILCSRNRVSLSALGFVVINQAHHSYTLDDCLRYLHVCKSSKHFHITHSKNFRLIDDCSIEA